MLRLQGFKRIASGLGALLLIAGITAQVLLPGRAYAAGAVQITHRSLTLQDQVLGGSAPSDGVSTHTVIHNFNIQLNDLTDPLGSISFQYCTTATYVAGGVGCLAPAGMSLAGASLTNDTGTATGFTTVTTAHNSDAGDPNSTVINTITIARASASALGGVAGNTDIQFSGVINPSTTNTTFFVRIYSYSTLTGGTLDWPDSNDAGTVAASTANPINLSGTMPESLVFCTGATISLTAGVPDCTTATSGTISFNALFSPTSTAWATSQMAASTNAGQGYAITVGGGTLTSGSNTIKAMTTAGVSNFGISQFGMNLVLNDGTAYANAPNVTTSANINPASNATNYNAWVLAPFSTNGTFKFDNTALNPIANSADPTTGTTPVGTDSQIYTASYIVNVPGSQPAGTYATTLTYICTPTF